jgi:hypothetical protein
MSNINPKGGTELSVSIGIFIGDFIYLSQFCFQMACPASFNRPNAVDAGIKRCRGDFKPLGDITRIRFRVPQCRSLLISVGRSILRGGRQPLHPQASNRKYRIHRPISVNSPLCTLSYRLRLDFSIRIPALDTTSVSLRSMVLVRDDLLIFGHEGVQEVF